MPSSSLKTHFEVVIPFGTERRYADMCAEQIKKKLGLPDVEVREVAR